MENIMELDELKANWQALDRRLQQSNRINLELFKERKLEKARTSLRPLFWGQLAQMLLLGLPFVLLAGCLWAGLESRPPLPLLLAGVFVHAYGVAAIALAGGTMGLIRTIDYSAPVLAIQKRLAKLRHFYIINGMIAGLSWWLMWVPVLMVLSGLAGVDLYARAPSLVWTGLGIGVAGLLATWWFHRWSRSAKRPKLAKAMEDSLTGGSLLRAQRIFDEIAQFEKE
jgi:hypothetical protein